MRNCLTSRAGGQTGGSRLNFTFDPLMHKKIVKAERRVSEGEQKVKRAMARCKSRLIPDSSDELDTKNKILWESTSRLN